MSIDGKEIQRRFWPHQTNTDQNGRINVLRISFEGLATEIVTRTPSGREQALALTQLEQAAFWAIAAIARQDEPK